MRKLYHHSGTLIVNGIDTMTCELCGTRLDDDLLSENPCSILTAHFTVFDELPEYADLLFIINVGNCQAALLAGYRVPGGMRFKLVDAKDEQTAKRLEDAILDSVDTYGAINISGLYGLTDDAAHLLKGWLIEGKISITDL